MTSAGTAESGGAGPLPRRLRSSCGRVAAWLWITLSLVLPACSAGAQTGITVKIPAPSPGPAIPADFVGLSFEMQTVLPDKNGGHLFRPDNRRLIATFRVLGIKSLRVGGNTADRPTLPMPGHADVDDLFAFARAAGVKVIYTLRLNGGDMAQATDMANYITRHHARQLDCFAIGNEPNVFSTNFDLYLAEWNRFAAAITAPQNSPGATFCGPSVSPGHEKWSARMAQECAGRGWLKYITQHDYPGGDARSVIEPAKKRDQILSPAMESHYAKFAANFVPAVQSNGLACRFEEANSLYDGGALDVSDTFAAALWALDYQWWWAARGIIGINFHTGDKVAARDENKPCRYASFWTAARGYEVHPIGYAEKMFSLGSAGKILDLDASPVRDFRVYGVQSADGAVYLTLLNLSHGDNATNYSIKISIPDGKKARAGVLRLAAPDGDLGAKSGVTLGGVPITEDGQWKGHWEECLAAADPGSAPVNLPAASAAIIRIRR